MTRALSIPVSVTTLDQISELFGTKEDARVIQDALSGISRSVVEPPISVACGQFLCLTLRFVQYLHACCGSRQSMLWSVLAAAAFASYALGEAWDAYNDPQEWNSSYTYKLKDLPTSARVTNTPWSDTYWPSFQGGIANRWQDNANNNPGFGYRLHTRAQLKSGGVNVNLLSPAEKYDILMRRYDYPTVHSEWTRCSPSDPTWEGLCHGWSPASFNYLQPNPVTFINADNITVPLGSSDVKALLIYFLGVFAFGNESTQFIAQRCDYDIRANASAGRLAECADVNAGTFHILFGNEMGLNGNAFVGDIDRSIQVWNQPLSGYSVTLGEQYQPVAGAAPGTVVEQLVNFTMYYSKETQPTFQAHNPLTLTQAYSYLLDLDAGGNILGGTWLTWNRLDFMWDEVAPGFYGYWVPLGQIYDGSVNPQKPSVALPLMDVISPTPARHAPAVSSLRPSVVDQQLSFVPRVGTKRAAWIVPANGATSMTLTFHVDTRRFVDTVRVYELDGNERVGAVTAVLHGRRHEKVTISGGKNALIVFAVSQVGHRVDPASKTLGFDVVVQRAAA